MTFLLQPCFILFFEIKTNLELILVINKINFCHFILITINKNKNKKLDNFLLKTIRFSFENNLLKKKKIID